MRFVIIGGGQAAASIAQKFRAMRDQDELVIISEEKHPPYQRPPLSKGYLAGEMELERLYFRPSAWYEENNVELMLDTKVVSLNRASKTLTLDDGAIVVYDRLVFATGSRPRTLPESVTHGAKNVYAVRNLDDIDQMLPEFQKGRRLVIVGGGYIGLEAAAVARKFEVEVAVVEAAPRILGRVASEVTATFIRKMHMEKGVEVIEGAAVEEFIAEGDRLVRARMADGSERAFDFMIVGIGILPNSEVAEAAGIDCNEGILIDTHCRTNDPDIFAAGDCTRFEHKGTLIRIESVGNAIDQGETVALNLAGEDATYDPKPWFWSDQYDSTLQIAGLNMGYDDVVARGDDQSQTLSIWYYQNDQLIAVDAINDARAYMVAKRAIEGGKNIPKDAAGDVEVDLKGFLKG